MSDHHPLQRELAIKCGAADVASKVLEALKARKRETTTREHELGDAADAARQAVRDAAGADDAKALDRARKAMAATDSDLEVAQLEREGIEQQIERAERELRSKVRDRNIAAVDICELSAALLEQQARQALGRFAALMRERHALARLAGQLATEAHGRLAEPIRCSDERCGLLERSDGSNLLSVLGEYDLSETFAPRAGLVPTTLAELLEIELPRSAEAAE